LITGALGLEIWQIYCLLIDASLPSQLYRILWLGRIALIAHLIEAVLAAFKANVYHKNWLTVSIYTFFVGFVGLLELLETSSVRSQKSVVGVWHCQTRTEVRSKKA
jgi:hypothetical protein